MVGEQAPKASRRGRTPGLGGLWPPLGPGRAPGRGRRSGSRPGGRRPWPVLPAVALLSLVAVGSLRRPPGSGTGTPRFPSALLQTLGLLALIATLAAAVVAVWTLLPGKSKVTHRRRNPLFTPLALMGLVLVLALL